MPARAFAPARPRSATISPIEHVGAPRTRGGRLAAAAHSCCCFPPHHRPATTLASRHNSAATQHWLKRPHSSEPRTPHSAAHARMQNTIMIHPSRARTARLILPELELPPIKIPIQNSQRLGSRSTATASACAALLLLRPQRARHRAPQAPLCVVPSLKHVAWRALQACRRHHLAVRLCEAGSGANLCGRARTDAHNMAHARAHT